MSDERSGKHAMAAGHRWRLIEMPDRGLAMTKVFTSQQGVYVTVLIRSNAISLFKAKTGKSLPQPKCRLLWLSAQDVSLERVASILIPQDAAESMAVFSLNRRYLLQVVRTKEETSDR